MQISVAEITAKRGCRGVGNGPTRVNRIRPLLVPAIYRLAKILISSASKSGEGEEKKRKETKPYHFSRADFTLEV